MRTIILIVLLLLGKAHSVLALASDSITIKGYYIIEYKKSQLLDKIKNDSLKAIGKVYVERIDHEKNYLFVPESEAAISLQHAIDSYDYEYRKTIYLLPQDSRVERYLSQNVNFKIDFEVERAKFKDRIYFSSRHNPDYLYCIFYVEGKAIKCHLENNENNRYSFGLRIDDVTKDKFFDMVLLYQYNMVVSDFVYLDGFEKLPLKSWRK